MNLKFSQEQKILIAIVLLVMVATTVYRDLTIDKNKNQNPNPPAVEQTMAAEGAPAKQKNIIKKINFKIADNKQLTAVLIDIKNVQHQVYGNSIDIRFQVTNKFNKPLTVRAEEVKVDGKKLDKKTVIMSQDIPAGETSEAVLTILEFEDHPLPAMQRSIEMTLNVYSWEDWDFEQNHRFTVSL